MIEDCTQRIVVLLKLTADRHEASHGLSETAGLLVTLTAIVLSEPPSPLTSGWPHLRCDVGLEKGDYK